MKKLLIATLLGLMALPFSAVNASAIKRTDPSEVPPPKWVKTLTINLVSDRRCNIINAKGESLFIERDGTDIGGGLTASRNKRNCYVTDQKGIRCAWGLSETLRSCRQMEAPK